MISILPLTEPTTPPSKRKKPSPVTPPVSYSAIFSNKASKAEVDRMFTPNEAKTQSASFVGRHGKGSTTNPYWTATSVVKEGEEGPPQLANQYCWYPHQRNFKINKYPGSPKRMAHRLSKARKLFSEDNQKEQSLVEDPSVHASHICPDHDYHNQGDRKCRQ